MHPAILPVSHLFESSSIERFDWNKYGRVLEVVLQDHGLSPDDIEAVSGPEFSLLVIWRTGHVLGNERGVFKKRIEIGNPMSYREGIRLVRGQKGVRGRDGMQIEEFNSAAEQILSSAGAAGVCLYRGCGRRARSYLRHHAAVGQRIVRFSFLSHRCNRASEHSGRLRVLPRPHFKPPPCIPIPPGDG
jgi:hypothetical protein